MLNTSLDCVGLQASETSCSGPMHGGDAWGRRGGGGTSVQAAASMMHTPWPPWQTFAPNAGDAVALGVDLASRAKPKQVGRRCMEPWRRTADAPAVQLLPVLLASAGPPALPAVAPTAAAAPSRTHGPRGRCSPPPQRGPPSAQAASHSVSAPRQQPSCFRVSDCRAEFGEAHTAPPADVDIAEMLPVLLACTSALTVAGGRLNSGCIEVLGASASPSCVACIVQRSHTCTHIYVVQPHVTRSSATWTSAGPQ